MLSLGPDPVIRLRDAHGARGARDKRDAAHQLIVPGGDPSSARKVEKTDRAQQRQVQALADAGMPGPGTFEDVAQEWLATVHEGHVSEGTRLAPTSGLSRTGSLGWAGAPLVRLKRPSCCGACAQWRHVGPSRRRTEAITPAGKCCGWAWQSVPASTTCAVTVSVAAAPGCAAPNGTGRGGPRRRHADSAARPSWADADAAPSSTALKTAWSSTRRLHSAQR